MDSATHREMRNRSGEILRRVAAGESIQLGVDEMFSYGNELTRASAVAGLRVVAPI